jgi:hypothetical protein
MTEKKKDAAGKPYMSTEEFFAHLEQVSQDWEARPWYRKLPTYAQRARNKVLPPGWRMQPKWFVQRGRRGWADIDTADLDGYVTRVLAEALEYMADHTHGWPDDLYPTFEDWQVHLRDLAGRLRVWTAGSTPGDYEVTRQAMAEFADQLGAYWD